MQTLYTLIVGIFFGGLLYYLTNYALVPYTNENILSVQNLSIVSLVFIAMFTSLFAFFHLILDKLFFRKFYQKARMVLALRRGILLGVLLAGFVWLRVFGFWETHIVLLFFSLICLFEAIFLSIEMMKKGPEKKEKVKKEKV